MPGEQENAAPESDPTRRRVAYVATGLMGACFAVSVFTFLLWRDTDLAWVALWMGMWTVLMWLYARRQ